MLPNTDTQHPVPRDSTSPSSPDPIDNQTHTSDLPKRRADPTCDPQSSPAKRQKRDTNSNKDCNHDLAETKSEDCAPVFKFTAAVQEAARTAWDQLAARHVDRQDFSQKEITITALEKLANLDIPEKSVSKLKKELVKYFRKVAMFKKSTRENAPVDHFVMSNPSFIPQLSRTARARDAARKTEGKKPPAQVPNEAEEEVTFAGVVTQPEHTVPDEWLKEAFKPVRLSTFDKSSGITFVDDQPNKVKGYKGYRTVRATSGVLEGDWYYECEIKPYEKGHCRLGWATRRSDVETPVGFDAYGFGIRDLTGEFLHRARPRAYGEPFGPGDVVGCRVVLPQLSEEQRQAVKDAEQRWLDFRFVQCSQGEQPNDSGVDLSPYGKVEFFKNGRSLGIPEFFTKPQSRAGRAEPRRVGDGAHRARFRARQIGKEEVSFDDRKVMKGGVYYPSISLFENAVVEANFGPHFRFPLPRGSRPMCEAAREEPPPALADAQPADAGGEQREGGGEGAAEGEKGTEGVGKEEGQIPTEGSKQATNLVGSVAPSGEADDTQAQRQLKRAKSADN